MTSLNVLKPGNKQISKIPKCGACRLHRNCISPRMPPTGEGRKGILFIAEAPGAEEDEKNIQLIGQSGQLLRKILRGFDIDLDEDCWKTNAVTCRPPKNRTPDDKEISYCLPNIINTIAKFKPKVIILLGTTAVKSVIGNYWKQNPGPLQRWVGYRIPDTQANAWICPTWHPSYLNRMDQPVLTKHFTEHVEKAVSLTSRPWQQPPDYRKEVLCLFSPTKAAETIRAEISRPNLSLSAFDYETNMLKPEGDKAAIVSCSICFRNTKIHNPFTIAYPWAGEAKKATQEYLRHPVRKIASNLKFEERWTKAEFGHGVRNWHWDTMIAAHIHDNRPQITGLKFQAYVHLGCPDYDSHIKPLLQSPNGTSENKVDTIPLADLLLYNGLDSLLELLLAEKQTEDLVPF